MINGKKNLKLTGSRSSKNKTNDQTYFSSEYFKKSYKDTWGTKEIYSHNYIVYYTRRVMYDNYVNIQH